MYSKTISKIPKINLVSYLILQFKFKSKSLFRVNGNSISLKLIETTITMNSKLSSQAFMRKKLVS